MDNPVIDFKPAQKRKAAKTPPEFQSNENLVKAILDAAWTKNGFDTKVYDVAGVVDYTDVLVIFSGRSERHVMAVAEAVESILKEKGVIPSGVEGRKSGAWVLLDFGNVVVHVFEKHNRDYYDLDRLWADAKVIEVQEPEWVQDFARMEANQFD